MIYWEVGALEKRFRGTAHEEGNPENAPLADHLKFLNGFGEVIFTGHSLGGAIAAFAFAEFHKKSAKQTGWLITFGAPRFGDEVCVQAFESNPSHRGRYLQVINRGDPVPEVPGTFRDAMDLKDAGGMAGVLKLVGRLRIIWAFMYRQKPPGRWTEPPETAPWRVENCMMKVGKGPFAFANHGMEIYKNEVAEMVRKSAGP